MEQELLGNLFFASVQMLRNMVNAGIVHSACSHSHVWSYLDLVFSSVLFFLFHSHFLAHQLAGGVEL